MKYNIVASFIVSRFHDIIYSVIYSKGGKFGIEAINTIFFLLDKMSKYIVDLWMFLSDGRKFFKKIEQEDPIENLYRIFCYVAIVFISLTFINQKPIEALVNFFYLIIPIIPLCFVFFSLIRT